MRCNNEACAWWRESKVVGPKETELREKLASAPAIELADPELWAEYMPRNASRAARRVMTYAEDWARLMQLELAGGRSLEDIAQEAAREADFDGVTGHMHNEAVTTLVVCWAHGEALRRWHNLSIDPTAGAEANRRGGILNSSIFIPTEN